MKSFLPAKEKNKKIKRKINTHIITRGATTMKSFLPAKEKKKKRKRKINTHIITRGQRQ